MSPNECKSSKYKLCFTLKQHTPMIHFQSDQDGATLRATELKPKLDRFLIDKVFNDDFEQYKELLIGYKKSDKKELAKKDFDGKKAFDYKVQIIYNGKNRIDYPKPFVGRGLGYTAPYFAGGKSIEHEQDIKLVISSFNRNILKAIKNNIELFFTLENFGTRQSKGFGSFHIEDITTEDFKTLLQKNQNHVFELTKKRGNSKEALKIVDIFYKYLKMGQRKDRENPYDRSLLFQYMCKTYNIGWEKKFLKNKFPEIIHGDHDPIICKKPDDREFKYIRALLGLAELNEYRPESGRKQIKIESVERDPKDSKKALYQRFKSPITFKIFNNNIYLIYNNSYEAILNKEFYFKLDKREKLFTPKEFDIYKFLKFAETKVSYMKELS